jgi:hypothetical protein
MIKGSFTSATGVIDIEFNDAESFVTLMDITQIGELSYSFDITPEAVTVDRLVALYSNFKFSFNGTNEIGEDVYEMMVRKLFTANRDVTLTITDYSGNAYEFRFTSQINDLEYDERTGIASLLCKPKVNELTFKQVFDQIGLSLRGQYRQQPLEGQPVFYGATGVASWIKRALPLLFGNNTYPVDFVPAKTFVETQKYSEDTYVDLVRSDGKLRANQNMFALVDMGTGFGFIEDGESITMMTGTIEIAASTPTNEGSGGGDGRN